MYLAECLLSSLFLATALILYVVLELGDVNYPGSTYTLQYFPEDSALAGKYYQAVDKVYYVVEFMREK